MIQIVFWVNIVEVCYCTAVVCILGFVAIRYVILAPSLSLWF